MKKLHKFVLKSYLSPLLLTFFISIFILLMQFLWKYVEDLVGKGLEWTVIAKLLLYASASLVPMALPLAILLAAIMTFGTLGENYELTALKSAGVSLQRIMFPLMMFIVCVSIGAFFFSNNVLPYTNLKTGALLYDVSHLRPELNIKKNIFNKDIEGFVIRIESKNPKTSMMYDFLLYDHTGRNGNKMVTRADSAKMTITADERYMLLSLYNGYSYEEMSEKRKHKEEPSFPHRRDKFDEKTVIVELIGFGLQKTNEDLFKSNYQMLNLDQLNTAIDSLTIIYFKRLDRFEYTLDRSYIFKNERKLPINDTTIPKKYIAHSEMVEILDIDSMIANTTDAQRKRVYETALKFGRSSKAYIESSKEDFYNRRKWINKHQIEWHRKFTLSFACLIFFFIGAPLGAIIRKGGIGLPVVVSILFFITYYIISLMGEKFVRESVIPPYIGMWISSILLLPIGVFLTWKATTDSVMMNTDTYIEGFKKILKKLNRKKDGK